MCRGQLNDGLCLHSSPGACARSLHCASVLTSTIKKKVNNVCRLDRKYDTIYILDYLLRFGSANAINTYLVYKIRVGWGNF